MGRGSTQGRGRSRRGECITIGESKRSAAAQNNEADVTSGMGNAGGAPEDPSRSRTRTRSLRHPGTPRLSIVVPIAVAPAVGDADIVEVAVHDLECRRAIMVVDEFA